MSALFVLRHGCRASFRLPVLPAFVSVVTLFACAWPLAWPPPFDLCWRARLRAPAPWGGAGCDRASCLWVSGSSVLLASLVSGVWLFRGSSPRRRCFAVGCPAFYSVAALWGSFFSVMVVWLCSIGLLFLTCPWRSSWVFVSWLWLYFVGSRAPHLATRAAGSGGPTFGFLPSLVGFCVLSFPRCAPFAPPSFGVGSSPFLVRPGFTACFCFFFLGLPSSLRVSAALDFSRLGWFVFLVGMAAGRVDWSARGPLGLRPAFASWILSFLIGVVAYPLILLDLVCPLLTLLGP